MDLELELIKCCDMIEGLKIVSAKVLRSKNGYLRSKRKEDKMLSAPVIEIVFKPLVMAEPTEIVEIKVKFRIIDCQAQKLKWESI